ncbi:tyrosine-type recombinase/integrase [Pantoea allii]|uniref:tyrosine-type recombinase/integrase n=1 Tax=Pantoea allii TaxID=574096 RepID=UPI003D79DAA2
MRGNDEQTPIIKIFLSTGCRWSEAVSLKATHLSPNKLTFINTKGKKNRSVPNSEELYNELKERPLF